MENVNLLADLTPEQQKENFEKIGRLFVEFLGQNYPTKYLFAEFLIKIEIAVREAKENDKKTPPDFYAPLEYFVTDFYSLIEEIEEKNNLKFVDVK